MALPEGFEAIDFTTFHRESLDGAHRRLAADAARGASSLALRLPDGRAYTYVPQPDRIEIVEGDDAAHTVLELDADTWLGLVHELEAPAGVLYARRARCVRGNPVDLMVWESALRALYNGRPPYSPATQQLQDRDGKALDLRATFRLDSDAADMRHFLLSAGYLFLRGVFSADEVCAMRREAEELSAEARPGDKLSWWGKNAAGAEVLGRVTRGIQKQNLAGLPTDRRLLQLRDLFDSSMIYKVGEGEGVTVIFKQPGMIEGLGDLPWHRDCGMGGHAVLCPVLVASVFLTAATPETGDLPMLPGSHRASFNAHDRRVDPASFAAHFAARPGDVSLHLSDTVHAAPPPTSSECREYRISAIVNFAYPAARHHRGESSYNAILHQREDGQIEHLEDLAKRM